MKKFVFKFWYTENFNYSFSVKYVAITLQDITQGTCLQGALPFYDISLSTEFTRHLSIKYFSRDKVSQLTELIS